MSYKIIAEHPTLGRRHFGPNHWANIMKWPNQDGWIRVSDAPKEPPAPAPKTAKPKAAKPKVADPADHDEILEA